MEATLIPQIKEDQTCEYLAQQAESYKVSKRHNAVPTTTTHTTRQISTEPHNLDYNRLSNEQPQKQTSFYPSNNNPSNWPANSHPNNNPDWDTITRNLDQKTKIELIQDKKCL